MIYQAGDIVPWRVMPGIVVASYVVSLVGATTTVEILHRRPEGKGWRNWLHRIAVAVSTGLVAIWCMHFVGNRAIVMGDMSHDSDNIQLIYSPQFTVVSVVLPVVCLIGGFTIAELRQPGQRGFWPCILLAGFVAGAAICAMHYVGNLGIYNYKVYNPAGYVVGAAIIAVSASVMSLSLFFYFQERWLNSFPRRMLCACVLAGAVSGMHWVATAGTSYKLLDAPTSSGQNRNANLIAATVMSLLACLVCLLIVYFTQRRKKQLAIRAQHVILFSITFDPEGKLLVTPEGLFPSVKITNAYSHWSFDEGLTIAHPVFQWLFRLSHYWKAVDGYIAIMRAHLRSYGTSKEHTEPGSPTVSFRGSDISSDDKDYPTLFREQFCIAASDLAEHLQTSLTNIGVLFDGIMTTGSLAPQFRRKSSVVDLEAGTPEPIVFGKGQAMFLVRCADKPEASRLLAAGYRFASLNQVGENIARTMQVPLSELVQTVDNLREHCRKEDELPKTGTFLACFAVRPALNMSTGGRDILVPKDNPSRLPKVELLPRKLDEEETLFLASLDGHTVDGCIEYLRNQLSQRLGPRERKFVELLLDRIGALIQLVPEKFFREAVFTAKAIDAAPNHTSILAFCVVPNIHSRTIKNTDRLVYTPLSFFLCRQRVYRNSPDHAILAQELYREFSNAVAHKNTDQASISARSGRPRFHRMVSKGSVTRESNRNRMDSSSSERALGSQSDLSQYETYPLPRGRIMMTQHVAVDNDRKRNASTEMQYLGSHAEVGVAAPEEESVEQMTYADELLRITFARFQH